MDGHDYPSVEHYYQACKLYTLGGARLAAQLRNIPDVGSIKAHTKKLLRSANVSLEKVLLFHQFISLFKLVFDVFQIYIT